MKYSLILCRLGVSILASLDIFSPNAQAQETPNATKAAPFVNSLGMEFVPVRITESSKRVLFSIWETRVQDYAVFVRKKGVSYQPPNFEQGPTHPVVGVTWYEARAFCDWLTGRERASGKIGARDRYRLPTDHEWSCAVGIGKQERASASSAEKNAKILVYPWGTSWPPPTGSGNFAGEPVAFGPFIEGYLDGYHYTAPVGSFARSSTGLFDLSGNVWEWCRDYYDPITKEGRILRGGSMTSEREIILRSSDRASDGATFRAYDRGFRCVLVVSGR